MEVLRPEDHSPEPTCAAVGSFDGLHLAHRHILSACLSSPYRSMVVTFRLHPVLDRGLLFTPDEKLAALKGMGVDAVLLLDRKHKALTAEEFLRVLLTHFHVRRVLMGFNHRFGRGREGSPVWIVDNVSRFPVELHLFPPLTVDGQVVSSSLIRNLLKEGKVEEANRLLGRRYSLTGKVVRGMGKGKELGFPTANLAAPPEKLVPADGVYVVFVPTLKRWGVMHVGPRPTLGLSRSLEVHVLDFSGDVPPNLTVEFAHRIRDPMKFSTVEGLRERIRMDVELARKYVEALGRRYDPVFHPPFSTDRG